VPVRSSPTPPERDAALAAWLQQGIGRALLASESELLEEALEDVFGWELVQIGAWGRVRELLRNSRTRRQTIIGPPGAVADVVGRASHLPVASDSVDAVLLPHTLDFASDPYAIVREADRVLSGEGQLLVLGFRPWSLWGVRARATRSGFPPGLRRVLSERRVRDWLVLLGYEIVASRHYLYRSPWSRGEDSPGATARMLRRAWYNPLPAGAWLLKARKRVYTLTPVRPRFREKPAVIGGLMKPTTRMGPS
jgi:SAM-dependent methyltransferase